MAKPHVPTDLRDRLTRAPRNQEISLPTANPSVKKGQYRSGPSSGESNGKHRRYFALVDEGNDWPPELDRYNREFQKTLEKIKRRHDSVVTTVGMLCCLSYL